jgi:uncharacterized protein
MTEKLRLNKELFEVSYRGRTMLYAPLEGSVLDVSPGVIGCLKKIQEGKDPSTLDLNLLEKLIQAKILITGGDKQNVEDYNCNDESYSPTSLTLLPTFNCNLRCLYCYASAGERIGPVMDPEIAKSAIDFIVENASKLKRKKILVGLHGGGEPLLEKNRPWIDYIFDYARQRAKEHDLKFFANAVTNGTHNQEKLKWIVNNFNNINLSFDGPKDIQNRQRPKVGNKPSFDEALACVKYFEEVRAQGNDNFTYGIRATITEDSVERMPEILKFFASISKNKGFHLEPSFECGRCKKTNTKSPVPNKFLEKILETQEVARKLGVEVYYSAGDIEKVGITFCGSSGSNFFVTPQGYVTTCFEACREDHPASHVFFIGKYSSSEKRFIFDEEKINKLKSRTIENIPFCKYCFAKYNCSGDCPAKIFEQSLDIFNPSNNWRCIINQGLLKEKLAYLLDISKTGIAKLELKDIQ